MSGEFRAGSVAALVSGMSCVVIQTVMLREFLSVFNGNELVLGVLLAAWMLLTAAGAWLGRFAKRNVSGSTAIAVLLLLLVVFAVVSVLLLNGLKNDVFTLGSMPGPLQIMVSCVLLLMPVCMASGYVFTLCCRNMDGSGKWQGTGSIYGLEAAGSIAGGILFNFVFIQFMDAMQSLLLLLAVNSGVAFYLLMKDRRPVVAIVLVLLTVSFISGLAISGLYKKSLLKLYPQQQLLYARDTPYGKLIITETGGQFNFFENGTLLFSNNNIIEVEEAVHYAMLQHPNPRNILLVSGGISGMCTEILKYRNTVVDYVELNPVLASLAVMFQPSVADPRVHVVNRDARMFVRETTQRYDVALINLPGPSSVQLNRYYSREFFAELKSRMTPGAVVSVSLPGSGNYMNPSTKRLNSTLYNTLKTAFLNVIIVPGERNYFIGSDAPCSFEFGRMARERDISTLYVNPDFIQDGLLQQQAGRLMARIDAGAAPDSDLRPVSWLTDVEVWLDLYQTSFHVFFIIVLALCIVALIVLRPVSLGLFTTGFTAASAELLLMIAFQVYYGYVYQMAGILITLFFAGMSAGSLLIARRSSATIKRYVSMQFIMGVYCVVAAVLQYLLSASGALVLPVTCALTLVAGFIAGLQFGLASDLQKTDVRFAAGNLYAADLAGSAMGALLTACLFVPFLGIINTFYLLAVMNIVVTAVIQLRQFSFSRH